MSAFRTKGQSFTLADRQIEQAITLPFGTKGGTVKVTHWTEPATESTMTQVQASGFQFDEITIGGKEDLAIAYLEGLVGDLVTSEPYRLTQASASRVAEEFAALWQEGRIVDRQVFLGSNFHDEGGLGSVRKLALKENFGLDVDALNGSEETRNAEI